MAPTERAQKRREEVNLQYVIPLLLYEAQLQEQKQDFTNRLDKPLHILPESVMGSVLGYTYLGENFMARRADLTGEKANEVDVHEAIHTPDEYETECITRWILSREKPKYHC